MIAAEDLLEVTVYGKPGCQQCKVTTRKLDKLAVPYTYRDVTEDPEAAERVSSLGYRALPVVTVGDLHWSGFSDTRIERLAKIHAGFADISSLDAEAETYLAETV